MSKSEGAPPPVARETVFLFGTPRVIRAGEAAPRRLEWHKPVALLAYLACRPGWHGREALAGVMRPQADDRTARAYVRRLLHRARAVLPQLDAFEMQDDAVRWAGDSDVARFERAVESSDWAQAIEFQRAPLLHQVGSTGEASLDDWFHEERLRLAQKLSAALMGRIVEMLPQGDAAEVMQRLAELDPLNESAVQFLLVHARTPLERHVAAGAFQTLQRRSVTELGQKPLPHTIELFRALQTARHEEPAAAEAAGEVVSVRSPVPTASPAAAPPQRTSAQTAPAAPVAPLGREHDLRQLLHLLAQPPVRLVTISGLGGAGKTLLARALQQALRESGVQETAWVDLAPAESPHAMLDAIAAQVGLTALEGSVEQQLGHWLAARAMVVFLDNFEQLAAHAPVLERLLRAAPATRLVVTSREALRLPQEYLYALAGLRWQGDDAPAARLFELHAARMGHPLAPAERPHVAQLAAYLEGLPLAIELAAHWLPLLPVQAILAELRSDPALIDAAADGAGESSGRMHSVFAATWRRLDDEERRTLAALSVASASMDLDTARTLGACEAGVLLRLTSKSLLQRGSDGRLRVHPLLRQFAKREAGRAAVAQARERHARHFLGKVGSPPALHPGQYDPERLRQLAAESDDIAKAWRFAAEAGHAPLLEAALSNLGGFLFAASRYEEAREFALSAAQLFGPDHAQASELAAVRSLAAYRLGRMAEAETVAIAALRRAPAGTAAATWLNVCMARLLWFQGDYAGALPFASSARESAAGCEPYLRMIAGEELALCYYTLHRLAEAETQVVANLQLSRGQGARLVQGRSLCLLGIVKDASGASAEALPHFDAAIRIFQEMDDGYQVAYCRRGLSYACLKVGDVRRQLALAQAALEGFTAVGARHELAESLVALAVAQDAVGAPGDARQTSKRALNLALQVRQTPMVLRCIAALGALSAPAARAWGLGLMCFAIEHSALRRPDRNVIEGRLRALGVTEPERAAARRQAAGWTLEYVCGRLLEEGAPHTGLLPMQEHAHVAPASAE